MLLPPNTMVTMTVTDCMSTCEMIFHMYIFDLPWLIIRLENNALSGTNAPPIHSICISGILSIHLAPTVVSINSRVTMDKPNIHGNAMKAVKRSILRKMRDCRSTSSRTLASMGWVTPFSIPVIN